MRTVKKYSRQFPIREYLYRRVVKTGTAPEQLPSERKLAQEFGVARETVRRVIAELEESKNCIRLPGKKALFTNPDQSNPDVNFIGILAHHCRGAELSHYAQSILSRIHLQLEAYSPFYQILSLPEHFSPEEKADYIFKQQHDALIWLLPEAQDKETLIHLWELNAPLTAVSPHGSYLAAQLHTRFPALVCPTDSIQFKEYAQLCKNETYQNPLFLINKEWHEHELASVFEQVGLSAPSIHTQNRDNIIDDSLKKQLNRDDIDAIFICLGDNDLNAIVNYIRKNKELTHKKLLVPHGITQKSKLKQYDLNITFLGKTAFNKVLNGVSRRAAEKVQQYINKQP